MGRAAAILGGVLVLALLAGGLTEATLAFGHQGGITDDVSLRPAATPSKTPAATPTPTHTPAATATPSPAAISVPPDQPVATTNAFVHLRAGESTSTDIVLNLNGGSVVQLLSISNAQWQEVEYNGVTGYVFKTYLNY